MEKDERMKNSREGAGGGEERRRLLRRNRAKTGEEKRGEMQLKGNAEVK